MSRRLVATAFIVLVLLSPTYALDQEFDIPGGRRLVLHEDGTYEVVTLEVDTAVLAGSQFVIDIESTIELAVEYAMLEDPSLAILGKDLVLSMMQEMGLDDIVASEFPDFSVIFLDASRVLFTMEDEEPVETVYDVEPDLSLRILDEDSGWMTIGSFSSALDRIDIPVDDGVGTVQMKEIRRT